MRRMKILFLTGILVLCAVGSAYSTEIEPESKINSVTIYPDSVLITRRMELKLNPSVYKVVLPDIIPEVDENSLKVIYEGASVVKLFGAGVKKEFLKEFPSEEVNKLKEKIRSLQDEIRNLNDTKQLLGDEKSFLDSIRLFSGSQLPKDLATRMPSSKELQDILAFLNAKLRENYAAVMSCDLKIRECNENIEVARRQLSQMSGPIKKMRRSIVIDLEVIKGGDLVLDVSYLARGQAYWQPLYDARASFEKSNVELISYALVKQSTGEDWENVELYLSTAKPSIGGNMPYVSTWILRPFQPRMLRKEARKAGLSVLGENFQTQAFEDEELPDASEGLNLADVREQGVSVLYKIPRRVTVKSDGSEYKLPLSQQVLNASFEYSSYPRVSPFAYLGSRVINSKELQLLGGRVNVFLEGDFVGTSRIANIGGGEEFDIYLGVDENIKISRDLVEKKVDQTIIGNVPSPVRRTVFTYKIRIENYKSRNISVKLFEAIPVSEDDRIKVKAVKADVEPTQKNWKDRSGIWLWELDLKKGEKKEITYTFMVEHPREMVVEGL